MRIVIANDHASVEMKKEIIEHLTGKSIICEDVGASETESADYPVYGEKVGRLVAGGTYDLGILICGTGVGMSLSANRIDGIRAVVCSEPYTAKLSREHNKTNILCFGSRVIGSEMAKMIVDEWLSAIFQGGRHQRRVDLIAAIRGDS